METATTDLSRVFERQIRNGELELPSMPSTASEVMAACQEQGTDAAKLSGIIHNDQTIASNVLRVANSAAYAGQVPCASLQQAVSRLGMQLITEIAMAVSVRGRLFANATCADALAALWKHSVLTGFFTKEIARARRTNVEIAFLCGLLHDIGKAVLLNNVDRAIGDCELQVPVESLLLAVHEQHIPAGVLLSKLWKLPPQVAEAIACHHQTGLARSYADMANTVQLADMISHWLLPVAGSESVTEEALRTDPVLVDLNLYGEQLDELFAMKERAEQVVEGMQ